MMQVENHWPWAVLRRVPYLFVCLAAYLTLLSSSRYGPGLTPDSVEYIRLAQDISENGFAFLSENKSVDQPPLYPMLLAATAKLSGCSFLQAATALNALASAGLVVLLLLAISRLNCSIWMRMAMGFLACFSIPFCQVWSMAWTEPLFICWISLALFLASGTRHPIRVALSAGLCTAAACLTRYAGIVLIPVIAVFLFVSQSGSLWNRCRTGLCYVLLPAIFFGLYVARNWALSGTPFGDRVSSNVGVVAQVDLALKVFLSWFLPWSLSALSVRILAVAIFLGGMVWMHRHPFVRNVRGPNRILTLSLAFILAYGTFIIWTSTTTAYDPINSRLLSPIYPFLLILMVGMGHAANGRSRANWILALCLGSFLFVSVPQRVVSIVREKAREGAGGYNTRQWHESEMIHFLRQHASQRHGKIFSNLPDALFILAGMEAEMSPRHRLKMNSDHLTGVNAENLFVRYPGFEGSWLVWCKMNHRKYLFSPEDLAAMCRLEPVRIFSDGAIYRIAR